MGGGGSPRTKKTEPRFQLLKKTSTLCSKIGLTRSEYNERVWSNSGDRKRAAARLLTPKTREVLFATSHNFVTFFPDSKSEEISTRFGNKK